MSGFFPDHRLLISWLISNSTALMDIGLVLSLVYTMLFIVGERRTLWMVRGLIILMLASVISQRLGMVLLSFVIEKLVIGSSVAMAFVYQAEFRRFLEQLGQGQILQLFKRGSPIPKPDNVIDEIVDAVKELSQNRTGALMVLETASSIDQRDFVNPGVSVNGEVSKELIQTIFQPKTLLHDGAVFIRGARIISAGVILPLSDRTASRQLGTRHRAAMGITERLDNCLCIIVSEETGSISLAEQGLLNRPLTSSKLKELLDERFSPAVERETVTPSLGRLGRTIGIQGHNLYKLFFLRSSASTPKKKK
ncbi:diadenylate cyclase CdaA [Chroococcus sp. FPU101]|uniref:diadenylate cyclase CdaA n=1 Tax=Chroococcus sp. FPU101 TaxID=1974212 RepID=UPI001A8D617B|nr:diadenylate cyclase CdaA [Chroococcus sp. FPU101]